MKRRLLLTAYVLFAIGLIVLLAELLTTEEGTPLSELEFVTYDNVLYSPEELRNLPDDAEGHVGWDYSYYDREFSRVRTNRILLHLTPGETYGLYTEQLTYAARLWVDGKLMAQLGEVSDSPEGFVPRTGSVCVYFTAGEETEIVMQRCNFNHAKWNAVMFTLGPQKVITRQVQNRYFQKTLVLGFLFTVGVLNLGLFAGMPERRRYLWFSLTGFCMVLHVSLVDPKLLMLVFPELNWYVSYMTEQLSLLLNVVFLLLFIGACFKDIFPRWLVGTVLAVAGVQMLIIVSVPTIIYTRYTVEMEIILGLCSAACCGVLLVRSFLKWKVLTRAQKSYLSGILVFLGCALGAVLRRGPIHTSQIEVGMILFELITTLALSTEFREVRLAYERSRANETHLERMNEALEENRKLQKNYLDIMNHEMITPLTVIAGYADTFERSLEENEPVSEEMTRSLQIIRDEALRLGRIVEQSGEVKTAAGVLTTESVRVYHLLEDVRDFCQPICDKWQNRIAIDCRRDIIFTCSRDSILQALYNLVLNAGRHCRNGHILLRGEERADEVILSVCDDGDGMDEETLLHAFEPGYTRDGGHGIGLALCREIAERHGGSIRIERNETAGITVLLTLPKRQKNIPDGG